MVYVMIHQAMGYGQEATGEKGGTGWKSGKRNKSCEK
jgi:hypothetical protein